MTADELTIKNYDLIKRREAFQQEAQRLSQEIIQNDNEITRLRQIEKQKREEKKEEVK